MRQKERIRNFVENALSESMDVQEQSMVLLGGDGDNGECEKEEYGYNKDLCNNKDSAACRKNASKCTNCGVCENASNLMRCENLEKTK